jgi:tubulin-specific chaperone A
MGPSQLQIAISALRRLVKEEMSYHEEMRGQEKRIVEMEKGGEEAEGEEGNREFSLRQEVSLFR